MDAYGLFTKPENVTLPDGNILNFAGRDNAAVVRDLTSTARKYINNEYADYLRMFIEAILDDRYLEEMKFDSDFDTIDAENENLRADINEIENILSDYEENVFTKKTRLYRKDLDAMLKALHGITREVV